MASGAPAPGHRAPTPISVAGVPARHANVDGLIEATVSNPTSLPTGTFDLPLTVDSALYANLINANWSNVHAIYAANQTPIYSWIETNASNASSNTLLWLRLSSIPAGTSELVDLVCGAKSTFDLSESGYTGENPLLSPEYAQFDNGWRVFNLYDNFSGSSLGAQWSVQGGWTYSVHDGITFTGTAGSGGYVGSRAVFSPPAAVDFSGDLFENNTTATAFIAEGLGSSACTYCDNASVYGWDAQSPVGATAPVVESGSLQEFGNAVVRTPQFATFSTVLAANGTDSFTVNYLGAQVLFGGTPTGSQPVGLAMSGFPAGSFTNAETTHWIRERTPSPAVVSALSGIAMSPIVLSALPGTLAINQSLTLALGTGGWPYSSYSYANLPAGCASVDAPTISCIVRSGGTFDVVATARDLLGDVATASANLTVVPPPPSLAVQLTLSVASAEEDQSVTITASVLGGASPYSFVYTGLPSGCSSQNSSSIACTPSAAGSYTLHVSVTDAKGDQASASTALSVTPSSSTTSSSSGGASTSEVDALAGVAVVALVLAGAALWVAFSRRGRANPPPPPPGGG
jgi:hypothetical protein